MSAESFEKIKAACLKVHGEQYTYEGRIQKPVGRSGNFWFLSYLCPLHGSISQRQDSHLRGQGCPGCALRAQSARQSLRFSEFLSRVHSENLKEYLYLSVCRRQVDRADTKTVATVTAVCSKGHLTKALAGNHINKPVGCGVCSNKGRGVDSFTSEHGVSYLEAFMPVGVHKLYLKAYCQAHGEFTQQASAHVRSGSRCPKCVRQAAGDALVHTLEDTQARMLASRSGLTLLPESYAGVGALADFTCEFGHLTAKKPIYAIMGAGCRMCSNKVSSFNLEISEYIQSLGFETELEKSLEGRKSVDVFVPAKLLAIDYHGNIWHSSKYSKDFRRHSGRLKLAKDRGWTYLQIFSDEWEARKPQIKARIARLLGAPSARVFARKCTLVELDFKACAKFLDLNHVQGTAPANAVSVALGLVYAGELVAVAAFGGHSSRRGVRDTSVAELVRYATSGACVGGLSKLLAGFKRLTLAASLVTYCDERMFSGGAYAAVGFTRMHTTPPDYTYVSANDHTRMHKSNFQKSRIAKRFGVDVSQATETQLTESLGFYKVYDCGKTKWVMPL